MLAKLNTWSHWLLAASTIHYGISCSEALIALTTDQRLQRRIGWVTGAAVNISYMIGSGIFVGPSFTMKLVGSGMMNVFIWFLGGVLSMAGAWTFAELGTMVSMSLSLFR